MKTRRPRMFFFRFTAKPKTGTKQAAESAGAFVNCWIVRRTQRQAEATARAMMIESGWAIRSLEEAGPISREEQSPEGMKYFEQAETDRQVVVLHSWPRQRRAKRLAQHQRSVN